MKYKTLFRLAVRFLGLYFICAGIVHVPRYFEDAPVSTLLEIIIGLYLFLDGRAVIDRVIPSNRPYCPECGYELTNIKSVLCPECGTRIRADPAPVTPPPEGP